MRISAAFSPGNDRRHGQEIDPDSVPSVTVLLDNLVLIADPILVPTVDGCRVVDTKNVDILNFKSSRLELTDNPTERTRGVRTGEDILVHEDTPVRLLTVLKTGRNVVRKLIPDEVFVLPMRTNTSNLEDEDAVVVEKVVDLPEEGLVPADTNVLETATVNSLEEKQCIYSPQPSQD